MAHALRYYKEIQQDNGQIIRLEIHKKDSALPAVEIGRVLQALRLDIQGGADTIDAPIVKTSLTMTFVDAPDLEEGKKCGNWEEFYTPDSTMWKVVLKADGKTIWGGYVTPDSYQEDLRYRGSVTIIARDNIGHMQDFPFDMEGNADGMVTLEQLVNEAWAKIESPMRLDWWHEEQEAMYLMCEGNDAPSTYMNVSAFEDMNFFDAVEKALYSYGLVMRYTGSNRVTIMSLRDLPYQGKSSAPRAIEPTFLAHAQRELAPAARRIEESVKYEIIDVNQKLVKRTDYRGGSIEVPDYSGFTARVYPLDNSTEGNGWMNPLSTDPIYFNPAAYNLAEVSYSFPYTNDEKQNLPNTMMLLCNNRSGEAVFSRYVSAIDCQFNLVFGGRYFVEGPSSYNLLKQNQDYCRVTAFKYSVRVKKNGITNYLQEDGQWTATEAVLTVSDSNLDQVTIAVPFKDTGYVLLELVIKTIEVSETLANHYVAIQALRLGNISSNPMLERNNVNTIYDNENNVIIDHSPELAPAFNDTAIPGIINNGIFVKSGNAYLPAKKWAWSGGTPQQMAVYNHLQLLCYHSKPNNIISGDIVNADFVDMEAIYEWGGANHLLVSGSYNFLNGRIESAVLREFKFYNEMWSDVSGTSLPDTEQNNRTTAESGSGASKASTYSNETTVNIGGTGGGGTGGSSTLAGLLDVQVSSPSNGQALVYDSVSGRWMNKTIEKGNDITSQAIISALGYTPFDSDAFTKANIKNALGIKDWALASSKPSYTWTEIKSRPTALSEFTNDLGLGSLAYKSSLVASDIPSLPWSKITSGKPTTLSGYGITDAYTKTTADAKFLHQAGGTITGNVIVNTKLTSTVIEALQFKSDGKLIMHRIEGAAGTYVNYGGRTEGLTLYGSAMSFNIGDTGAALILSANKDASLAANLTVAGLLNSTNFMSGGYLTTDPTSSFQSSIFGATDSSYRIRTMRSAISVDRFTAAYAPMLTIKTSDTHAFISIGYNTTGKSKCYIGAGINDALKWRGILFHDNMDLIPKDDGAFYLGYSDKRWRTLNAVDVSANGLFGYVPNGGTYQQYRVFYEGDKLYIQAGSQDGLSTVGKLAICGIYSATLEDFTIYSQQTSFSGAVKIGDATLKWDASKQALLLDKTLCTEGDFAAGGEAEPDESALVGNTEWYNIRTKRLTSETTIKTDISTVIENFNERLLDTDNYRIVLMTYKRGKKKGYSWRIPMLSPRYNADTGEIINEETPCAIAWANTWWPVISSETLTFNQTGSHIVDLINIGTDVDNKFIRNGNKKIRIGFAIFKKTYDADGNNVGTWGWQRVSNIAEIMFYRAASAKKTIIRVIY